MPQILNMEGAVWSLMLVLISACLAPTLAGNSWRSVGLRGRLLTQGSRSQISPVTIPSPQKQSSSRPSSPTHPRRPSRPPSPSPPVPGNPPSPLSSTSVSPAPPRPAHPFASGYYAIQGTNRTVRCVRGSGTFQCSADGANMAAELDGNVLFFDNHTATWDNNMNGLVWSYSGEWRYTGADNLVRPDPSPESGPKYGPPACEVDFGLCSTRFVGDSCPATSACPAGGESAALNSVIDWLDNTAGGGLKTFLSLVGFGAAQVLAAAAGGAACDGTGSSSPNVSFPLYSGAAVKAAADSCANLPLADDAAFFTFSDTIKTVEGCVAIDACTQTFGLGFKGLEVTIFTDVDPPVTVSAFLDVVALSLTGNLVVTPAQKLWDLSTGGTGTFVAVPVKGHVNVEGGATVTVGKDDISISVTATINVLVNYDPLGDGANSPVHDHGFLIQVAAAGPVIKFGPNQSTTIDLSNAASINAAVNWLYLGSTNYKMQLQLQGTLHLSEVLEDVSPVFKALDWLMPTVDIQVTLSVYADQNVWGVYLGLAVDIQLNSFEQGLLDIIGVDVPQTLDASAAIMLVGNSQSTGAKIIVTVDNNTLFTVNFCSQDSDCVNPGDVCIHVGSLGACTPQTSCTKNTYLTPLAGVDINTCPEGTERSGALCYPPCRDGFYMVGPVCWQSCPPDMTDTGLICQDSVQIYGKGCCCTIFGCCGCPGGWTDDGCTCRRDRTFWKASYGNGAGVPLICPPGTQQSGALCYVPCKPGYTNVAGVCWQDCPTSLPGSGTSPMKDSGTYCTSRSDGVITLSAAHLCPA